MAAADIYAMDYHMDRLAEDHKKAREIGKVLSRLAFIEKVEPVETNIVISELKQSKLSESGFLRKLQEKHISIIGMGQGSSVS